MPLGASNLRPLKLLQIPPSQKPQLLPLHLFLSRELQLQIRTGQEIILARPRTEVIRMHGIAERDVDVLVLCAKDDHVEEIRVRALALQRRLVAEHAALAVEGRVDGVEDELRGRRGEVARVVQRYHALVGQQGAEVLQEAAGEEGERLCAAREDVVEDVVVSFGLLRRRFHPGYCVLEYGCVVCGQAEVFGGVFVD